MRKSRTHPVLIAWSCSDGVQLRAWCPFCQDWHYHGRHGAPADCSKKMRGKACPCRLHENYHQRVACTCPRGSGDGHRVAHCHDDAPIRSPFRESGYILQEAS